MEQERLTAPLYKDYLEKKGYTTGSIPTYLKTQNQFIEWCTKYGTTAETIDYKTFLKYIEHLRERKTCGERSRTIKPRTLKSYVSNLKIYFNYLVEENYRTENVIQNINIKGVKKEVIHHFLSQDELEDLYQSYNVEKGISLGGNVRRTKGRGLARKRNKIMLGLLIYQGVTTQNLQQLQVEEIQLYKGKIDVLGTKKSNGRILELKPWQLMELMEYIKEIRPQILEYRFKNSSLGEDAEGRWDKQLFLPLGSSLKLQNSLSKIVKELKKINHKFIDIKQIRTSVIVNWLKQHNLRKVQYFAGHRYISSTERYQQDDLESLHKTINTFHPFS
jgi:site-specific recombinase XerD